MQDDFTEKWIVAKHEGALALVAGLQPGFGA
jgi:hypothetical protein